MFSVSFYKKWENTCAKVKRILWIFKIKKSWRILAKGQRMKEKTAWTFENFRRKIWAVQIKRMGKKKAKKQNMTLSNPAASSSPNNSFTTKWAFGKATARAKENLPKSPRRKREVISALVSSLSPSSKNHLFKTARRKLQVTTGWPCNLSSIKDNIIFFLERPDISYCKPGRQDTVYCGKNDKNEKIYRSKHFLLWTIKELVALFNKEHDFIVTYYSLQQVIKQEKHIFCASETSEEDCRC